MIDAGLRAAHIRTGLFTSPHLQEPTERIQIDGIPISETQFARAFDVVHALNSHATYFEMVTAMGFWLFREMGVETAVVEVGLGGRLDATNVVEPALTVITPVDFDHQSYLGDTIEAIAGEKAGILKARVPLILAKQLPGGERVIEGRAAELGVAVTKTSEFSVGELDVDARGSRFVLGGKKIVCPLAGEHQVENAVTAALALRALDVGPEGIADAQWPGRLEHVAPNPDIILDGAHNPAGARALVKYLRRFYSHRRIWMIFGAMTDKAVAEVGEALFPVASELVFTAPHNARAMQPQALVQMAGRGRGETDIGAALEYVKARASDEDAIVVTGSLYLVGEARALLSRHAQRWS
jgi:dihydrofolate synthase/folylpolyglutamate synthase